MADATNAARSEATNTVVCRERCGLLLIAVREFLQAKRMRHTRGNGRQRKEERGGAGTNRAEIGATARGYQISHNKPITPTFHLSLSFSLLLVVVVAHVLKALPDGLHDRHGRPARLFAI